MVKTVAFIPLRGGSKSIPLKNIKRLAGKPLASWTIEAALASPSIDEVVVATDSDEIRNTLQSLHPRLRIVGRSAETATDTASTESVLLEFAASTDAETIVLIQATSPLLTSAMLDGGLDLYKRGGFDSLLSAVRQKRFIWSTDPNGEAVPQNYEPSRRPRRQDFDGHFVENGAFYITSRDALVRSQCRLSGKMGLFEMPEETFVEIDEPADWQAVESILRKSSLTDELRNRLEKIRLLITDVDGVLTDAGMYYSETGDEQKKFNTRDGKGIELLRQAGVATAIITSENTEIVRRRAMKLNIEHVIQGAKDKLEPYLQILNKLGLKPDQVCYIGDDVNDRNVLLKSGFAACPADAMPEIREIVHWICQEPGGRGCVREIAELVLRAQSK